MDHSALAECKGVPAYAVIAMKRTALFCAVNKGGTASALVPYWQGASFFMEHKEERGDGRSADIWRSP
ncbi:hypothetical protein PthBH41_08150 [Parageobacillus thermoglucosidasius]|nr:hypothetical protein PthBH41_08150 [Parageobacillus thermoglucosidasius]